MRSRERRIGVVERGDDPARDPTVGSDQLTVLWLAAELARTHGAMQLDVSRRLRDAGESLAKRNDPAWRRYQRWFEIYLTLMGTGGEGK